MKPHTDLFVSKFPIVWLDETDSTNSEAKRLLGTLEGISAVAALHQSSGRGQRGNIWVSRKGENLTFSIVLKFPEGGEPEASKQFSISQAVSLGICDYLDALGVRAKIKWPNDIYVCDRKICGVLIENSLRGHRTASSIIGIGLNLNQSDFPPELPNPTSVLLQTGRVLQLKEELPKLCGAIAARLNFPACPDGALSGEYAGRLYRLNEVCEYADCARNLSFKGEIVGTSESGLLRIKLRDNSIKEFAFKEIAFVV